MKGKEGNNRTNVLRTYSYAVISPATVRYRTGWPFSRSSEQGKWQVLKPGPKPFLPGRDPKKRRREEMNKKPTKSDPVSISRLPNPSSNDHHLRSSYLGVGLCQNHQGRVSAHDLASMGACPAGIVRSLSRSSIIDCIRQLRVVTFVGT